MGTEKNRLNETPSEHPEAMLKLMGKKIFTILQVYLNFAICQALESSQNLENSDVETVWGRCSKILNA